MAEFASGFELSASSIRPDANEAWGEKFVICDMSEAVSDTLPVRATVSLMSNPTDSLSFNV